jgi:signal transduction histidine kinase
VDLVYREDGVRLTVTNPLTGGRANDALRTLDAGYGLTGMRERLLLLRGSLEAGQRDGQWVVVADLPLTSAPVTKEPAR